MRDLEPEIPNLKQMTNIAWGYAFYLLAPSENSPLIVEDADTLLFAIADLQNRAERVEEAWEREIGEGHGIRQLKS